jgi:micrococcal nuclease
VTAGLLARATICALALLAITAACAPRDDGDVATPSAASPVAGDVQLIRQRDGSWRADNYERIPLAHVVRVVDGDTLIVRGADGSTERVRVFGLRAPEVADACGPEATADLERTVGTSVRLLADERTQDQFGRELRYVFTPDGTSVDAELIRHGSARAWRDDGAFRDILIRIESTARNEGRGCLWKG